MQMSWEIEAGELKRKNAGLRKEIVRLREQLRRKKARKRNSVFTPIYKPLFLEAELRRMALSYNAESNTGDLERTLGLLAAAMLLLLEPIDE